MEINKENEYLWQSNGVKKNRKVGKLIAIAISGIVLALCGVVLGEEVWDIKNPLKIKKHSFMGAIPLNFLGHSQISPNSQLDFVPFAFREKVQNLETPVDYQITGRLSKGDSLGREVSEGKAVGQTFFIPHREVSNSAVHSKGRAYYQLARTIRRPLKWYFLRDPFESKSYLAAQRLVQQQEPGPHAFFMAKVQIVAYSGVRLGPESSGDVVTIKILNVLDGTLPDDKYVVRTDEKHFSLPDESPDYYVHHVRYIMGEFRDGNIRLFCEGSIPGGVGIGPWAQ